MCGTKTQIVTAVDISGWTAHDTNYFIPLLERTATHFDVREVSADKAYLSRKNLNAVEVVGGMPFVPFKSNTLEPTEAGAWARMYHLFMHRREEYMEALPQAEQHRDSLQRDKGKVWQRPTLQERYGTDQRSPV
jgi:hypothetical protein